MSQYDAKMRHMKRNLYKRPILHRGIYLGIAIRKHRPCAGNQHSRIRTLTPTQYSYVSLPLLQV